MFVVPAITMRLLSEEKRTGTIEVLLTGPVNEWQVVISKFLGGLIFFLVLSIPWGLFLVPLFYLGRTGFDYLPLVSYYLALVCSGAAFIAMGLFFSSLTRNQVIAAVLTFAGMFLFLAFLFFQESIGALRPVVDQLSFYTMWMNALSGQLQVHRLITFLSIAVFWLYLTTRVLEARKWS
jgi:ABC-type transport system involved in multi-copper enzyme maturation permease subunit